MFVNYLKSNIYFYFGNIYNVTGHKKSLKLIYIVLWACRHSVLYNYVEETSPEKPLERLIDGT